MQKILQNMPGVLKVHLFRWQRVEASNGDIVVVLLDMTRDDPHHGQAS